MKQFVLLATAVIALGASAFAAPHASREQVLEFLRREGIISAGARAEYIGWDDKANWWSVSIRHPSGSVPNWTVDSDARDYRFVCKN